MTVVGALSTAVVLLLLSLLSAVPSDPAAMTGWVQDGHSLLAWSDELLFFAILCWGAGVRGVFGTPAELSMLVHLGVTALRIALGALLMVLLAVGRLVYPVFGIELSAPIVALVVSVVFGALHLALLGFAVAAAALGWSTSAWPTGRIVAFIVAAVFLVGSFPWLIPSWCDTVVAIGVGVWGISLAFSGALAAQPHPGLRS
ncbi:hypothetical protein ACWEKT_39095 [Nocardia takedensis]